MSETVSDDSHDFILPVDNVPPLLAPLNEARLKKVATTNCYVATTDGAASEPPVTAIKNASIQLGKDAAYYLYTGGKRLEISLTLSPRSTCAFNNGPDGNIVFQSYKNKAEQSNGIQLESGPRETYIKKMTFNSIECFEKGFRPGHERQFEWSTSGTPVNEHSCQFAVNIFEAVNTRFKEQVMTSWKTKGLAFIDNGNGPSTSMFVFSKRPVLIPNAAPMDEGQASDYTDPFEQKHDFKFNRIPETLVVDHRNKTMKAMSFHHLHLLGPAIVMQVVVLPRAYEHNKNIGWDFRLVCIKILGKKTNNLAISPSKLVQKRKQVFLDLDDNEEDLHTDKRPKP